MKDKETETNKTKHRYSLISTLNKQQLPVGLYIYDIILYINTGI